MARLPATAGSLRAAWQPGLLGGFATRTSNEHDKTVEPANTNVWPCTSAATNNTVGGTTLILR